MSGASLGRGERGMLEGEGRGGRGRMALYPSGQVDWPRSQNFIPPMIELFITSLFFAPNKLR